MKKEKKIQPPIVPPANEKEQTSKPISKTWNKDSLDELEDWIEEQGIQLRY